MCGPEAARERVQKLLPTGTYLTLNHIIRLDSSVALVVDRIHEICRITMCQTFVHRITTGSPQKRTGVFLLGHYLTSRTLLWAGHVTRMSKNRLPKRIMLSWNREPRVASGQEMTYGRSLQRYLNHFDFPTVSTDLQPSRRTAPGGTSSRPRPPSQLASPSCGNHPCTRRP